MGMGRRVAVLGGLLLLLLLAIFAPVVRGYPRTAEPAFGLRELREHHVSDDGRRMTLDFAHDDPEVAGRRIEVNYDVELAPHIRPRDTDREEHLLSIVGSADGKMRLTFDSAVAAAAFAAELAEGDMLHGHYQDGPGEEAAVFPYHARVLASTVTQETLNLNIDIPTLTEVFINAKASIMVALAPEDQYLVHHSGDEPKGAAQAVEEETPASTSHKGRRRQLGVTRRKLGGTFDWGRRWLDRNLQHISKLGEMVLGVMDMAVKLVNFAVTGDLYGQMNQAIDLFEFNYDKAMKGPICGFNLEDNILPKEPESTPPFWGECRQCYAYSTVALRFEVVIEQYDVQKFVAMVDGAVDFNFLMDKLFIPSAGVNAPFRKLIKSIRTKNGGITVRLGSLYLTIGAYVPVSLGADMWVSGAATFGVDMSASAKVKAGYRFVKAASPQHQMVGKVDWDFGGRGVRLLRWAGREVGVRLSLFPVVQLDMALGAGPLSELAYIGGPNLGLEASVSAMVTASNSSTAVVERTTGVEGAIGANITLRLGNDKKKDLLSGKGEVTPKGILSLKYDMGKDEVRFKPFSVPSGPRRLVYEDGTDYTDYTDDMYIATDDDAYADDMSVPVDDDMMDPDGYLDSAIQDILRVVAKPEPIEIPVPEPDPIVPAPLRQPPILPYDWGQVGITYDGSLEQLKNPDFTDCGAGLIPPFLDVSAVVLDSGLYGNGGYVDCAITFTYGKTEPKDTTGTGLGAFAAITQGVYRIDFYNFELTGSCSMNVINARFVNYDRYYPNVTYSAKTTAESIDLPYMVGTVCDNGKKIKLYDTMNCFQILLERNTTTSDTSDSTRRELDALSNEERRGKLGHMDRFPRILQQCAPPKPPTPSPTRPPTSPPPPTTAPTRTPSRTPTTAPSTAPTRSPSHAPTRQPSQTPSSRPTYDPTHTPIKAPSTAPTRAPSEQPTQAPSYSPSSSPTASPTEQPTQAPSTAPTREPTTAAPSQLPTAITSSPTRSPTAPPPSQSPSAPISPPTSSAAPSPAPSGAGATAATGVAATSTSTATTTGASPSADAQQLTILAETTDAPTTAPSGASSSARTDAPTTGPSSSPTAMPSTAPTDVPSAAPTASPSSSPTAAPSSGPSSSPTASPTEHPTSAPTSSPTAGPTSSPTASPTAFATEAPFPAPSAGTPSPTSTDTSAAAAATESTSAPSPAPSAAELPAGTSSPTSPDMTAAAVATSFDEGSPQIGDANAGPSLGDSSSSSSGGGGDGGGGGGGSGGDDLAGVKSIDDTSIIPDADAGDMGDGGAGVVDPDLIVDDDDDDGFGITGGGDVITAPIDADDDDDGYNMAAGGDVITAPADAGDYSFEPGEEQAVEIISSQDYTKPPTAEPSTDDDIEIFYVASDKANDQAEADAKKSERPAWMYLAAGFGAISLTIVGAIRWVRKKWHAFATWRTQQTEQQAAAPATPV